MWRTWFKVFGFRVIAMVHIDGAIMFRFAKFTSNGIISSKIHGKVLLPLDGTGVSYITKWYEI